MRRRLKLNRSYSFKPHFVIVRGKKVIGALLVENSETMDALAAALVAMAPDAKLFSIYGLGDSLADPECYMEAIKARTRDVRRITPSRAMIQKMAALKNIKDGQGLTGLLRVLFSDNL